ncbi:tripartite tricarboxylate transporter substrate binding protein [Achromobacter spanius]|uniref:tripartite tricarboxylate transporter substrate binding protein n=1 Tax=Achromobacter spanius TaxID=217203 RepID=UPI00381B2680
MRSALSRRLVAAGALLIAAAVSPAQADYPERPIRLIVTFVPGGGADLLARYLGQALTAELKQTVVVENRPGAGGMIGVDAGRNAPADGYTLTLISSSYTVNPSLYRMTFDPVADITPIVQVSRGPLLVVTNPDFKVKNVAALIDYAKQHPGAINYASSGQGSVIHLANELFNRRAGVTMTHIPYKGGGNAQNDLMAGQVQLYFAATASALPHVASGKMNALAVTTPHRIAALPDVPTIAESGLPGFDATLWYGLIGPKNLPAPIVDKLNAAVNRALQTPEAREKLLADGAEPAGGTPAQFAAAIGNEISQWSQVVKDLGIKPE